MALLWKISVRRHSVRQAFVYRHSGLSRHHGVKLRCSRKLGRFQRVCTSVIPLPRSVLDVVNSGRGTRGAGVRESRYRKFIRSMSRLEFFRVTELWPTIGGESLSPSPNDRVATGRVRKSNVERRSLVCFCSQPVTSRCDSRLRLDENFPKMMLRARRHCWTHSGRRRGPRRRCRCWCWRRLGGCSLFAAEYCATGSPSKSITVRIDCQCPNISTGRNQPAANIAPNLAFVC
jgi:hypothetical protein